MQRPPSGRGLPLAQPTPIHDWIKRIGEKESELANLVLSPERDSALKAFIERAFTKSALALAGLDASDQQIALVQESPANVQSADSVARRRILTVLESIRVLQSIPDTRSASLTPDLLLRIQDPHRSRPSPELQQDSGTHAETSTERAMPRIRAFCDWVSADSFLELNPLEQASIVILRLLEIRPFEEGNVAAALGAGSLFTLKAGWPPIVIPGMLRPRFNQAVGEGLQMNTRPMVDLLAESIYATIDSMIDFAKTRANRG
jgi:hypothetical protein